MADEVAEPLKVEYWEADRSKWSKALGFHPGCPVYEVTSLEFDLEALKRALFESTYAALYLLPFTINEGDVSWEISMVVESIRAVYEPYAVRPGEEPTGCWPEPEWM